MKIIRRTTTLLLVMLTAVACSGSAGDGRVAPEEFCEGLWDKGHISPDWGRDQFTRECLEAIEAGLISGSVKDESD